MGSLPMVEVHSPYPQGPYLTTYPASPSLMIYLTFFFLMTYPASLYLR